VDPVDPVDPSWDARDLRRGLPGKASHADRVGLSSGDLSSEAMAFNRYYASRQHGSGDSSRTLR
jgi:hypothetical protein